MVLINPYRLKMFYKLHGSLNWKYHRKFGVIKLENIEMPMKRTDQYQDDVLIRPT